MQSQKAHIIEFPYHYHKSQYIASRNRNDRPRYIFFQIICTMGPNEEITTSSTLYAFIDKSYKMQIFIHPKIINLERDTY